MPRDPDTSSIRPFSNESLLFLLFLLFLQEIISDRPLLRRRNPRLPAA